MAAYNNTPSKGIPILLLAFSVFTVIYSQDISDKRQCADKDCQVVISKARALARYSGDSPLHLSFQTGDIILVKSKSAGSNQHLWGGEVNGQRGYFDKSFVREHHVYVASPQHTVDTESNPFSKLGKPPPSNPDKERRREQVSNSQETKDANVEEKKDPTIEAPSVPGTKTTDTKEPAEQGEELQKDDIDDKQEEKFEDLIGDDVTDPTDLDEDEEDEDDEEYDDDDDAEEEESEYLAEEFWEEIDDYEYESERDRFDTAGFFTGMFGRMKDLNKYLKKKLVGDDADVEEKSEPLETPSVQTQESPNVEPQPLRVTENKRVVEEPKIKREEGGQTHNDGVVTFDVEGEEDDEDDNEIPVYDPSAPSSEMNDDKPSEEINNQEKVQTDEENSGVNKEINHDDTAEKEQGQAVDYGDDYDPTEIDESAPDDVPMQKDDDNQSSNVKVEKEEIVQDPSKTLDIPSEGQDDQMKDQKDDIEQDKNDIEQNENETEQEEVEKEQEKVKKEQEKVEEELSKDAKDSDITDKPSKVENKVSQGAMSQDESPDASAKDKDVSEIKAESKTEQTTGGDSAEKDGDAAEDVVTDDIQKEEEDPGDIDSSGKEQESGDKQSVDEKADIVDEEEAKGKDNGQIENEKVVETKEIDDEQRDDGATKAQETQEAADVSSETQDDQSREIDSEVRPDTPAGTLETAQGVDPISEDPASVSTEQEKSETLPEPDAKTVELNITDGDDTLSESQDGKVTDEKGDTEEISDTVASLGTQDETEVEDEKQIQAHDDGQKEGSQSPSEATIAGDPVQDTKDEEQQTGGGFADFLQSSSTEPGEASLTQETPKLDTSPTASVLQESSTETAASAPDIASSKTEVDHQDATGNDDGGEEEVVMVEGGKETVIEDGTTMVFDADGEMLTAIMPEDVPERSVEPFISPSAQAAESTASPQQIQPTAADTLPKPTEVPENDDEKEEEKDDSETPLQTLEKQSNLTSSESADNLEGSDNLLPDANFISEAYQSSDFNSRKMLSVNQPPQSSQRQQQQQTPPITEEQKEPPKQPDAEQPSVEATPAAEVPPSMFPPLPDEIREGRNDDLDILAESVPSEPETEAKEKEEEIHDFLPEEVEDGEIPEQDVESESTTQPPLDNVEIPAPPVEDEERLPPEGEETTTGGYETDTGYNSRKINDEDLYAKEEEEIAKATPGIAKRIIMALEGHAKVVVEKLPPSVQSMLEQEPLGLSPNMTVLVFTFSMAILISVSFSSCCSSGGKKRKLRASLDVIQELEAKLQLAIKEKENIEDMIQENKTENTKLKEEMAKQKKDSGKNNSELQTVQLHNETLKKQLATLKAEVEELRENASSKQGEVKQQSKRTKDLEKQIKKIEEREKKLEQDTQKLTSDLKHKEDEVESLTTKVSDLTDQISHLQTRKDQLLAEAEDWKEKVSDMKERLEQREEEFKQMQENIMFKDNELEVLKDCFLQLKSFEENEGDEENEEDTGARVQEKMAAMMDVSKVNASLRAIEEEKDNLANKLEIEMEARKELEEQLENSRRGVETSMADKMKAERQCQEAQTKLNVLSSYFKEKELQLQRELGEQEALKKQNQNKLVSADEATRSMQQETELIRTQNESLKRELASSERDFRSQIAANEKKAHENWLAARAAERELKEARHEAGVLRQKLTDLERRQFTGPGGLIRPLPTRGMPPLGMMNGPPPPGMDRSPSRGSMPPLPPPHLRDEEFMTSPRGGPPPPMDPRRGPPPGMMRPPPPGARSPPDARSPPPRLPPFGDGRSPPPRMPPPGMLDGRSPPPYDRRPPPPHLMDRRSPPFRLPPPDMFPPPGRGGPPPPGGLPPLHLGRGGSASPPGGYDSPRLDRLDRQDGQYPLPPYARNPPHPSDRPSPRQSSQPSPRQQQSQV